MAVFNWLRTTKDIAGRGGALVTRFDASALANVPDTYAGATTDAQMWEKIFCAHCRDIRGSVPLFEETFHDEGKTDMAATMQAYVDVGFDGPMRPDHAPTMEGENNENPGYMVRGQIFAVGYMKGLLDSIRAGADTSPGRGG